MTTSLPEPALWYDQENIKWSWLAKPERPFFSGYYTTKQIHEYGAAEYARAIKDAAKVCDDLNDCTGHSSKRPWPNHCAWAVRKLGKANEKVEVPTAAD